MDSLNGYIFNDILIPEEILMYILDYVEIHSILNCRQVCRKWNSIIKSELFWKQKIHRKGRKYLNELPWFAHYYFIRGDVFEMNMLKNGNGENNFEYWKIVDDGGNKWRIENIPGGSAEKPLGIPEFYNIESCFVTSYQDNSKFQIINLGQYKAVKKMIDLFQPKIVVSEWYAGRFDCSSIYELRVRFHGVKKNYEKYLLKRHDPNMEEFPPKWHKVQLECLYDEETANDLTHIEFYHRGRDSQFWAGHYGSKMAGGVVQILYELPQIVN